MDTAILVEELDRNALKLITLLDKSDFLFTIAALMKNEETEDWILVFGIPDLNKNGSKDSFVFIYRAIKDNELILSLNDIRLVDDRDVTFGLLRQVVNTGHDISRVVFRGNYINGVKLPDSIIYRVE